MASKPTQTPTAFFDIHPSGTAALLKQVVATICSLLMSRRFLSLSLDNSHIFVRIFYYTLPMPRRWHLLGAKSMNMSSIQFSPKARTGVQTPLHHPLLALDESRAVYQSFGQKRDQEFGNRHNRRMRDQHLWVHSVCGRGPICGTPADVPNSTGVASRGPKGSLWYTHELFRCFRELTKYTCVATPTVCDWNSRDMNCVVHVGGWCV